MKFEVVEKATGYRVARTLPGQLMSTTLFDTPDESMGHIEKLGLSATHETREALSSWPPKPTSNA